MASLGDLLLGALAVLGPLGLLATLYVIFVVDAAVFPALPEVFAVLFFVEHDVLGWDPLGWGVLIVAIAVAGEATGNSLLYAIVRKALVDRHQMPALVERAMRRWTSFLVVSDERIILLNRIAPVVPMVGAFIATLGWDFRRSLAYVVLGAAAKYGALIALAGTFGVLYDPGTARLLALVLVAGVLGLSLVLSLAYRRRLGAGKDVPADPKGP
jgi:membrane protein DedA with SNARE-associated domain